MMKKISNRSFHNFSNRIKKVKKDLVSFIEKNHPIAGYGASTKGNIVF